MPQPQDTIAILDYGSQYTQLIARRVREAQVYCELFPWDAPAERVLALRPGGFILSGGPNSVYESGAPTLPGYVLAAGKPVLGICYSMQLLAHALGGQVAPAPAREYGPAELDLDQTDVPLLRGLPTHMPVWMSHGDRIDAPPPGFVALARSANSPVAAMADVQRRLYGVLFHPEVRHTPDGERVLRNFLFDVCQLQPNWTTGAFIDQAIAAIRAQVGTARVICALSGGVDSAVAATLVHRAVGDQLTCVFVDTGLLRLGEPEQVIETFRDRLGARLVAVRATEEFVGGLAGVRDPEDKRRIIGETFIRVFEAEAARLGDAAFLAQGTAYPDVIESRGPERQTAARIKTHHNVGGLPADMRFRLVEPLRFLFKDEIRAVGEQLGLPPEIVWRQPFPGPGLAVRVLGEVTWERLEKLRAADAIVRAELRAAGLERSLAQSFAVLLPVQSVAVMGDGRVFADVIAIRAVTSEDFMTADFARLPWDLLARISARLTNEVKGVSRVAYDVSSKPPATIEWE